MIEKQLIKKKIDRLNYLPFTSLNTNSFVYIGGLPKNFYKKENSSKRLLFQSYYQGFVRNLRYGICGCRERIQKPIFSSLLIDSQSEVCEQQMSLCSSSSCECLNIDEQPRYQCDCSNKTCPILTTMSKLLCVVKENILTMSYLISYFFR